MKKPAAALLLSFIAFALVSACAAKDVTLHGFVTAVNSPTSFEIDDYKITDDTASVPAEKEAKVPHLKPGELRVGLEVEVKGAYYPANREVMASAITALHDDEPLEGVGLVENTTNLAYNGQTWSGTLVADGEILSIAPGTIVTAKRSRIERKELRGAIDAADPDRSMVFGPAQITPGTFVNYQGRRQVDGSILLKTAEFQHDYVADEEQYDWKLMAAHVDESDSQTGAGTLTVGETVYTLFPCPQAQEYLTKLGTTLIPQRQRDLPDNDPAKVRFRFFLIDTDTAAAGPYPNGIVVVSAHMFDDLDDEAQLAFVLAHDIARAVEKQAWRAYHYHRTKQLAFAAASGAAAPFTFGGTSIIAAFEERGVMQNLVRELDSQADRVGLEYMFAAGYDPREAPETWRAITRDTKERGRPLFWGNREHNLLRRSYLGAQLNLLYSNKDLSMLKKDSPDFHAAVDAIRAVHQRKTKK